MFYFFGTFAVSSYPRHLHLLADLRHQSLQNFSGAHFCKLIRTVCDHRLDGLRPANGAGQLLDEVLLYFILVEHGLCGHVLVNMARGLVKSCFFDCRLQFFFGWLHQRRVKSAAHRQHQGAFGACGL